MLDPGTKVVVLASSIKKGIIGPRKGSIGYANSESLSNNNSFTITVDSETALLIGILNITFFKYGFDKNFRKETKEVCALLPVSTQDDDGTKTIDNLIQNIKNDNFVKKIKSMMQQAVPSKAINKKSLLVIGVPNCCGHSLIDCSINEFCCWFESIVLNNNDIVQQFQRIYDGTSYNVNLVININVVKHILDCAYSNDFKKNFFANLHDCTNIRRDIISTIRKIGIIYDKRSISEMSYVGATSSFTNNTINHNNFFNYFVSNLFSAKFHKIVKMVKLETDAFVLKMGNNNRKARYKKTAKKGEKLIDNLVTSKNHTSKLALSLINA